MRVVALDRAGRRAIEDALRRGEPVDLHLSEPPPPEVRLDDIVPLCHGVQVWSPALTLSLQGLLPPRAKPGADLSVSVVIPTNRHWPIGLQAFCGQDVAVDILVLDNGEQPIQPEFSAPNIRVERVPWQGHGPTRQAAVDMMDSEYVLFTVDDAMPMGAGFVRTMVQSLEDGEFDAVFARQVPWPLASEIVARRLREWTPPGRSAVEVDRLDHVCALYRRQTLLDDPLPDVPIAEDLHWGRRHRVGYVPMAPVLHSHERRPMPLFRRTRDIHVEHLVLGDRPAVPTLFSVVRALPGIVRPTLSGGPVEFANQIAELVGQWAAIRQYRKRQLTRLP